MSVDRSRLPAVGEPSAVRFPRFTIVESGGPTLRVARRGGLPIVSVILLVPSGTARDPHDRHGLTSLTAALLDEGAGSRGAIELHEAFARLGTHLETDVGADCTTFGFTVVERHFDTAMSLLGDVLAAPHLSEDGFTRERELRLSRLLQMREMPSAIADRAMLAGVYGAHPYGHGSLGTERAMREVSREEILSHHASAFGSAGTVLIACGDVDEARVQAAASRAFSAWHAGSAPPEPPVASEPAPEIVLINRPGAAQTELRVARVATPRRSADYHALVVLNLALGGQFVSRINSRLREEKGYTYGARTGFDLRRGPGMFICQTAVERDATADALNDIFGELRAVAAERPIAGGELERAKTSLARGYARGLETVEQITRQAGQIALYGLPEDHVERFVPQVRALTAADIAAAVARDVWPASYVTVAVGDAERVQAGIESLGLAPVRRVESLDEVLR